MNATSSAATKSGGVKSYWHHALDFAKRYWIDEAIIFSPWGAMIILGVAQALLIKQIVDEAVYGVGDIGALILQISAVVGTAFLIQTSTSFQSTGPRHGCREQSSMCRTALSTW